MNPMNRKSINKFKLISLTVIITALFCTNFITLASPLSSRANIVEEATGYSPTALGAPFIDESTIKETLHVNQAHANASDANAGTDPEQPLLTIKRGLQLAAQRNGSNIGVRVLIYPGTYREQVGYRGNSGAVTVIEATEPGQVIVSGSKIFKNWVDQGNNTYTRKWPYTWGVTPLPSGWQGAPAIPKLVRRREMIFVDGQALRPVKKKSQLTDNTFHVAQGSKTVTIKLSAPLGDRTVEVAKRANLLSITSSKNVVVRGLVFQHSSSPFYDAAGWVGFSTNVLLENNTFQWNSGGGLGIGYMTNMVTRGNRYIYNGTTGFGGSRNVNLLVENDIANNNLWRGLITNWVDNWSIAGIKHLRGHGVTYRNVETCYNHSHGLWLDSDHRNVVIENLKTCNNASTGLFLEANWGPFTIRDSIFANNTREGISAANVKGVTVDNNIFYNNGEAQIIFTGRNSGRQVDDWQTGQKAVILPAVKWTITNNIMIARDSGEYVYRLFIEKKAFKRFKKTLTADNNTFYHRQSGMPFKLITGVSLDLDSWRAQMNKDMSSIWEDTCFLDPDNNDFTIDCGGGGEEPAAAGSLIPVPAAP